MASDWIHFEKDDKHVAREKERARKLRKSQWWKNRISEGKCHYCNGEFSPRELTADHIVPLSRGGKSSRGNMVPCCKNCNSKKKYMTPAETILNELKEKEEG